MSSEKPSREELINQAIQMLDRVIATCGKMIASYEKHRTATTPTPLQVETLAAMEEVEIAIPPVAAHTAVDVVEVAPPTPPTSSVPPVVPTCVSKSKPPSEVKTFVAVRVDPFPITSTLVLKQPTASLISPPVRITESPSLVVEPKLPLESTVKAAPASLRLTVKRHGGKPQFLLFSGRPQRIQGRALLGIRIISKCVILIRGRIILGQVNPWRFTKKQEVVSGMFGVDGDFLYLWKKRKKGGDIATTAKMEDDIIFSMGKRESLERQGFMACAFDFRYLEKDFSEKTFKRKRDTEATIAGNENNESMEMESSLPLSAKRSTVSSADNPDKPNFKIPIYDRVITRRVLGWNWKCFRKRLLRSTVVCRRVALFEERLNHLKRDEQVDGDDGQTGLAIGVDLWIKPPDGYGSMKETCQGRSLPVDDAMFRLPSIVDDRSIKLGLEDKAAFSGDGNDEPIIA